MKEFTWNEETIDYFAELYDSNGWTHDLLRCLRQVENRFAQYQAHREL